MEAIPSSINLLLSLLEVMQLHHFKPRHSLSFVQRLRQTKPGPTGPFTSAAVHVTSNKRITLLQHLLSLKGATGLLREGKGKVAEALWKEKSPFSKNLSS